ncbi:TrbC/VirB2 family protein (plasmid) [Streptosporangium sp. CA-135522]|uniref:TrbC/VirB2 family protein n=1 Tax=Streptosporangium sp. CA-135522 TaxID=3240072 RepID=UPI003D8D6B84
MTTPHLLDALTSSLNSALHLHEIDWTTLVPGPDNPGVSTGTGTTTGGDGGPFDFKDAPPQLPGEVKQFGEKIFGLVKATGLGVAVVCFAAAGIMVMMGKGRSHNMSAQGLSNGVSVVTGLLMLLGAVSLVNFFSQGL